MSTTTETPGIVVRLAQVLTEIAALGPSRYGHTGPDTPPITAVYTCGCPIGTLSACRESR